MKKERKIVFQIITGICNRYSVLLHLIASVIIYFFIEVISRHSFGEAFQFLTEHFVVFAYNAYLIFVSTLWVYFFRRRIFLRLFLFVFWIALGITNGIVLSYRITPFTGPDLRLITDAMKLITVYLSVPLMILVGVGIIGVVAVLVVFFIKAPKFQGRVRYWIHIPFVTVMILSLAAFTDAALEQRLLSKYFGNIAFAYQDYGFPYCLMTTVFDTGISMPDNYSQETIEKITESEEMEAAAVQEVSKRPNIIFVQLETFFDPALVEFLELSEDPIPFFRSLCDNYSSGYFRVPSVGAGTANTEFETITGMNMRYFGAGEYPYKTILQKNTCESIAYVLKELGYTAHAIHNNDADFYDRNLVFSKLGFDTYTALEYMDIEEFTPKGWAKDKYLTETIIDCLDSTEEQDFIFAISVQGHGEYPIEKVLNDPVIQVSGLDTEEEKNQWEYYINQLYEMDLFVKELVDTLSDYNEEMVVVFYGDHLPTMDLKAKDLENRYLFETEYVIWNNCNLSVNNQNLSAYQMGAEVMEQLNIHEGIMFRYHQSRKYTKNYLLDMQDLQYDILYGEKYVYDSEIPYEETDLQMGVKEVKVVDYWIDEGMLYVWGHNFTDYSVVEVNDKLLETQRIDSNTLAVPIDGDQQEIIFAVCQISSSNSSSILSRTKSVEINYNNLKK